MVTHGEPARRQLIERGRGLAVVLLHGFPLDGRIWEDQVEGLSDAYRVIVPDLPGFGRSGSSNCATLRDHAAALHALLEAAGALPCVLGGLSMGGYIALAFARLYPNDLKGLMFVDTKASADDTTARAGREKMIATVRADGSKAIAEAMLPKMLTAHTIAADPSLTMRVRAIMESQSGTTIEIALRALRDRPDHTDFLPSIAVPTLVVVGDSDPIISIAVAQAMSDAIPKSTLAVIKGSSHLSSMEQPAQVTLAMRRFLDGVV